MIIHRLTKKKFRKWKRKKHLKIFLEPIVNFGERLKNLVDLTKAFSILVTLKPIGSTEYYVSIFGDDNFLEDMCKYTIMRFHRETGNILNISINDIKACLGETMLISCFVLSESSDVLAKDYRGF